MTNGSPYDYSRIIVRKKPGKFARFLQLLPFLLLGAVCGFFASFQFDAILGDDRNLAVTLIAFVVTIIILVLSMVLQVILHELGHLLFGLAAGFGFSSFRIGSLMFIKQDGKLKTKRYSLTGTAGQCLMTPPDGQCGKKQYVLYNLGGCFMNLLVSGIFAFLWYLCSGIFSEIFLFTAFCGLIFALTNGIPTRLGDVDNDGYNTKILVNNPEVGKYFMAQLRINELSSENIPMKDMPAELFEYPPYEEIKDPLTASIPVFACCRAVEMKDFEKAQDIALNILSLCPDIAGVHEHLLTAELAFCQLIDENDSKKINYLYTDSLRGFIKASGGMPSIRRLNYAYALLHDGNAEKAEAELCAFEKLAKKYPNQNDIENERQLIELAKSKFDDTQK